MSLSKKKQAIRKKQKINYAYDIKEAITFLKEFASKKFEESVDVSINLGVDPRKSDQAVRASTNLPKGTGKKVRIAVFAQGDNASKALAAGADEVGFEDLAEKMKAGELNFDVVIATPDAMRVVGQLGQVLGPRGLMPNPKVGTVATDVALAVQNAKAGQIRYRTDKNGIIHCTVGKISFTEADLIENISTLLTDLKRIKPTSTKGVYFRKLSLSTTMGPGLSIDLSSIVI